MRDMEAIAKFLWEIFLMEIYGKHYSLVLFSLLENALIKAVIRCSIAAAIGNARAWVERTNYDFRSPL